MKPLENVWSGLVQRRLLPVAILLLGALVAVPFLLAKDPQPAAQAPEPAAQNSATAAATADPVVQLADASTGEAKPRRRVLGASKNPFEPAAAPKVKATPTPDAPAGAELRRHRRRGQAGRLGHPERPGGLAGHVPGRPGGAGPRAEAGLRGLLADGALRRLELRRAGEAQPAAPEGPPVGRGPRPRLPGPGQGRQDRGLPARRGCRGAGRRRLQAEPAQLRDAAHARRRHRVPRRQGRVRAT